MQTYDIEKNILAPGLIDPHMHIESSMITGCAYAEAALLNGTTTIFCDSTHSHSKNRPRKTTCIYSL